MHTLQCFGHKINTRFLSTRHNMLFQELKDCTNSMTMHTINFCLFLAAQVEHEIWQVSSSSETSMDTFSYNGTGGTYLQAIWSGPAQSYQGFITLQNDGTCMITNIISSQHGRQSLWPACTVNVTFLHKNNTKTAQKSVWAGMRIKSFDLYMALQQLNMQIHNTGIYYIVHEAFTADINNSMLSRPPLLREYPSLMIL